MRNVILHRHNVPFQLNNLSPTTTPNSPKGWDILPKTRHIHPILNSQQPIVNNPFVTASTARSGASVRPVPRRRTGRCPPRPPRKIRRQPDDKPLFKRCQQRSHRRLARTPRRLFSHPKISLSSAILPFTVSICLSAGVNYIPLPPSKTAGFPVLRGNRQLTGVSGLPEEHEAKVPKGQKYVSRFRNQFINLPTPQANSEP